MSERASEAIVITGTGVACGLGLDAETAWQNVLAGRRAIGPMPAMESALPPGSDGGQALDLPGDFSPGLPREPRYLRYVILQAIDSARLNLAGRRVAVMLGTTLHGMRAGGRFLRSNNFNELSDFLAGGVLHSALGDLSIHGGRATTCSACSSGLGAIALGHTLLRTGEADVVIAGGYDPISEYAWAGFNSLRLVSGPPLRPFAKGRSGMKIAEAYAVVVMERQADAVARGATPHATIAGYGESADAHHLTQPHPHGQGAAAAMRQAIARAGLSSNDIGLAAAHATGTPDNDAAEFAAMQSLFGQRLPTVPAVAFKGHLGHTLGGAGAIELVFSALALRDGIVPPTVLDDAETVEFDSLNLARNAPRPATINATLNTSLGFGGANTSVVLTKIRQVGESASRKDAASGRPFSRLADSPTCCTVVITGIGAILPGVYDRATLASPPADQQPFDMAKVESLLNARRVRRMSDYVKLTLAAVAIAGRDAFGDSGVPKDTAAVLGTTHGSANFCEAYYRQLISEGATAANPLLFAEGVPNAAAAQLSLMLGLTGVCQTIVGTQTAGLDALRLATLRIAAGEWDRAIVSAGEETSAIIAAAYASCGGPPADDTAGAAAVVLESEEAARARGARVLATITHTTSASGDTTTDALSRALAPLPNAETACHDNNRLLAAVLHRIGRDEKITPPSSVAANRFSVTPLSLLAMTLDTGGRSTIIAATDATGLATAVRIASQD